MQGSIREKMVKLHSYILVKVLVMPNSVTSWTVGHQAALSMEFSRQKYLSGLSFSRESSQAKDQTPVSYTAGRFFTVWPTREALMCIKTELNNWINMPCFEFWKTQ